ncbi:MAG: DUF3095 domain-containing protein [Pseudomonadota bacterium]
MSDTFYADLPPVDDFGRLIDDALYAAVPDDWIVGCADIVGSTAQVAQGRYKTVNTVGAAVISAMINASDGTVFPYVFGGDGACFVVPPSLAEKARETLAAVKAWALDEFAFDLRAALVPVTDVRKAGHDVRVARYRAAPEAIYAMATGSGLAWAEEEMKDGRYTIAAAPSGTFPDLTGLSCRWTPMEAQAGQIVSLLVIAEPNDDARSVLNRIVSLTTGLDRAGTPVPPQGPGYSWVPEGLELEARATRSGPWGRMSLAKRKAQLLAETFIAWIFHVTGASVGGFSAKHYTRTTGANADFRKFDDGLKMTIDCDRATREELEMLLQDGEARGLLRYGLVEQDSAIMTCIVPSITRDDHVHFVDGSNGGYTRAAAALKSAAYA